MWRKIEKTGQKKEKSTKSFKMETYIENIEGELQMTRQLIPKFDFSY